MSDADPASTMSVPRSRTPPWHRSRKTKLSLQGKDHATIDSSMDVMAQNARIDKIEEIAQIEDHPPLAWKADTYVAPSAKVMCVVPSPRNLYVVPPPPPPSHAPPGRPAMPKPSAAHPPLGGGCFPREIASRTPYDRYLARLRAPTESFRDTSVEMEVAKACGVPWDIRGPPGPQEGGPRSWRGQKFREGSQRWANRGGKNKDLWKEYYNMKNRGLTAEELQRYHPKARLDICEPK